MKAGNVILALKLVASIKRSRVSQHQRCATVTFYGKMLEVSSFFLPGGVKNTRGRTSNKKASDLPPSCGIAFQLALALAFWHLGFTLCEWRKSIIIHPCFTRNDSPPRDPHWDAEVYYRKRVIWREITASCLSLTVCEERNHNVCTLSKKRHTHMAFIYI